MKKILSISILAIIILTLTALSTSSKQFSGQIHTKELCRAKAMTTYENAWDNCCYTSGQSVSCKAKNDCEPSWNTYTSQMRYCLK